MPVLTNNAVLVLTPSECRMLWQAAQLDALRIRSRSDEKLYSVLASLYKCGLTPAAGQQRADQTDIRDTQSAGITADQLAKNVGVNVRTIRRDIATNRLPATKTGGIWLITPDAAHTYIETRRSA